MLTTKEISHQGGERFAIVDELATVSFLSREEFDLLKQRNPRLIQMQACDLVYLTELPPKGWLELPYRPKRRLRGRPEGE